MRLVIKKLMDSWTFHHHNRPIYMSFNVQVVICFSYHLGRMLGVMKNFTEEEENRKIDEAEAAINEEGIDKAYDVLKVQNR